MSDRLSHQLQAASNWAPRKEESSDQTLIRALEKALEATTPERPGCPWDREEKEHERRDTGFWLPQGD